MLPKRMGWRAQPETPDRPKNAGDSGPRGEKERKAQIPGSLHKGFILGKLGNF